MFTLKLLASRGALALASIAIPILAAEIILRLIYAKSMSLDMEMAKYSSLLKAWSHSAIGHVHKPGKKAYLMGHYMTINGFGLRDLKESVDSSKGAVAFVGDSFALGWGVGDKETIPYLLEHKFIKNDCRINGKKIEVFNLGVGNYNSRQENLALLGVESKLKPDLVIVLNFVNDAEDYTKPSRIESLLRHSYVYSFFSYRIRATKIGPLNHFYNDIYTQSSWEDNLESLKAIKNRMLHKYNAPTVYILLPEMRHLKDNSPLSFAYSKREGGFEKAGLEFYDLRRSLFNYSINIGGEYKLFVSPQDSHTNALANTFISNRIFKYIIENKREVTCGQKI